MKSTFAMLLLTSLAACSTIDAGQRPDEQALSCQTLEAATGTNRLSRQRCSAPDQAALNDARDAAEALQRDQIQRSLPRPMKGGS